MGDYRCWQQTFSEIVLKELRQTWTINICNEKPNQMGWKSFTQHNAFAEYHCPNCGNHWKSIHAAIEFYIQLIGWQGNVMMKPLGQQCKNCINQYIKPEMPNKIIRIIVHNLIKIIRKEYYGEYVLQLDPADDGQSGHGPHIKKLCEACQLGKCKAIAKFSPQSCNTMLYSSQQNDSCSFGACLCFLLIFFLLLSVPLLFRH